MMVSLKSSSNAAINRLRFMLAFLDVSFLIRFNAIWRMIAKFSGEASVRMRDSSSLKNNHAVRA
jgi:hypothetical protein